MTVQWTLYDEGTGKIIASGDAMNAEQANLQATGGGRIVLIASNPETDIISNPGSNFPGVITKPNSPIAINKTALVADGTDAIVITNIPTGSIAAVLVPDNSGINPINNVAINDGNLSITTTVVGSYSIAIQSFPNADYKVSFNAT